MKVYALVKYYDNEVDSWETIRELYSTRDKVEKEYNRLLRENKDPCVSFYIKELRVL